MQIDRMKKHLDDTSRIAGDYIDFRIYKGTNFVHLANKADAFHRTAFGVSTPEGLGSPTANDKTQNGTIVNPKGRFEIREVTVANTMRRHGQGDSYKIINGTVPEVFNELPDTKYAFAIVDMLQYLPTKQVLEYVWPRMSYGGTLYFDNYFPNDNHSCSKAINEFIEEHEEEIIVSRQMMINGTREKELAIKCLRSELRPLNWSESSLLKKPVTMALVLKTGGGVYDYKYVNNLVDGIKENLTIDHRIVCLTDNPKGFTKSIDEVIKFKNEFPKWWGKIELFRPHLFEDQQVFYFDLDTFIVGSLDQIVFYDGEFCALRDFYHLHTMGSGVMSWNGNRVIRIYDEFMRNPRAAMNQFAAEGDQAWINTHKPSIDYFQDMFPNEVVSYKAHCAVNGQSKLPKNAKVVCFHGKPRPHEVTDGFRRYWKQ